MIFCTPADSLQLNLASDAFCDCVCSWVDMSNSANPVEDATHVKTTGSAGDFVLAAAPAAGWKRVVKSLSIQNVDTTDVAQITVRKVITTGPVLHTIEVATLQPGQGLFYEDGAGWYFAPNPPNTLPSTPSVMLPLHFATANLTSAKTIASASTFAVYVGKAPRGFTSATMRLRVTTAAATITWAEVALARGSVVVGGNPVLTVVGWADAAAIVNSLGQKSITVNVASGQAVAPNDDLWVLIGNTATTPLQVRAQSIADDIQVGLQASLATRPSLNVGVGQAYTIEGATTLAAWVALVA